MRLFVDANVLFSAAHRAGHTARDLFDLAAAGLCEAVSSAFAAEQARRNVAPRAPERLPEINSLASGLRIVDEPPADLLAWAAQQLPAKDAPILAAAVHAGVELLVTGDKRHFGSLYGHKLKGVETVLLRTAITRIMAQGTE